MTELKPCPFCGGEAVVDKYPVRGYEPAISFVVRCSRCGQKRVGGNFDTVYKSEKWARRKAIEAWNTRPSHWHTGTPTENGDYLVAFRWGLDNEIMHDMASHVLYGATAFVNGNWRIDFPYVVVAWQKIDPYKEN